MPWMTWVGCWGRPFNHGEQDEVGGAHLGTCTSPLFPHSLFTSSLPQTFHSHLLGPINRPGKGRMCLCSVVVDVEAKQRMDLSP
jgi:hypothetical protein